MKTDEALRLLDEHPDFRVLRRFRPPADYAVRDAASSPRPCVGAIIDTETTGLSIDDDPIIELGIVLFEYDPATGVVYGVLAEHSWLEDPRRPIPEEITALTGIDDSMVAGQRIDEAAAIDLLSWADVVIAHNAAFDRPRLERRLPAIAGKNWACSYAEIGWAAEGMPSKLEYMLAPMGLFAEGAHRAVFDCRALLHVLATHRMRSGQTAFASLLESARRTSSRIYAVGSPYGHKETLYQAGYRWNDGSDGAPKAWNISVFTERESEAIATLQRLSPPTRPKVIRLTAADRYTRGRPASASSSPFAAIAAEVTAESVESPVTPPGRRSPSMMG